MVSALGGPADFIKRHDAYLPLPEISVPVMARPADIERCKGRLGFDTRGLGLAVIELGGGRTRPQDPIDHAVGLSAIAEADWDGTSPICVIHARDQGSFERARARVLDAIRPEEHAKKAVLETIE